MEKINEIVANNIAILRKKNRLSLEELGKLSRTDWRQQKYAGTD